MEQSGKHLVFTTDPESVKDEFAFDNPGFRQEEKNWQHEAPTLPLGGKTHALHAEFTKPEQSKDDSYLQRARIRRVKLWARDFTGLGLTCGGGARDGVCVHSVLRSGPAAAAKLQPGDKIKSIKIEFTGTPLEDAVSILSLASPYPVELEVIEGGRVSGEGWKVHHPLMKRAGSTGDVNTLEKEGKLLHPPRSPDTSHSNNSTLETKYGKGGIKKIITEKIITTTLERSKKERKDPPTTLERENEKNLKLANKARHSDTPAGLSKPERNKNRNSTGSDIQIIQPENGITHYEHAEVQKREYDPKRGMKFGIRVLPPNVPDDGVLKQKSVENGAVVLEKKTVDEPDKPEPQKHAPTTQIKHENEVEQKKPVVAKRREKIAPPIPNARVKPTEPDTNTSHETSKTSEISSVSSSFTRTDLNSSGIKRDENGIPQELPQHMFDAAKAARSNRKSSADLVQEKEKVEHKKEEAPKPVKKSKGKAPSPPEPEKNKSDDSILEQMKNLHDFLNNEKQHSSLLHDSLMSNKSMTSYNTSTPKVNKTKSRLDESINFSQDDIDDIVSRPFKRESDSLNNFFADSKSNLSSNQDVHSVVSFNNSDKSDKGSTTIELNNSDITIHSSPLNDTGRSTSDDTSLLDENERKAASLGDLSRFELRAKTSKPSTGTLERAQSLDISADDAVQIQESTLSPKKRKAMSVVETTFFDSGTEDVLPEMIDADKGIVLKQKEPRLSLNIAKTSAMEGLNTFQRNRLKKASEFGNLEDAIVKGSNSSMESSKHGSQEIVVRKSQNNLNLTQESEEHETSDHLARRIMDENLKVHLKLVSEFAKSTTDGGNASSSDNSQESVNTSTGTENKPGKYEEKLTMSYDTNIPDDMKVSRSSYVNSLERPKSEMMKKLLAKNPIFNVHVDQTAQKYEASTSKETPALTDSFKSTMHQPDIVNFDLKTSTAVPKNRDYDDFVSNIRVGSNNNSLKHNKKPQESFTTDWPESKNKQEIQSGNIVTISTDDKKLPTDKQNSYTKSIEIGETSLRLIPDLVEGTKTRTEDKETRTLYMEPANMSLTMKQEPVQKTVTVNVSEDEYGNKVITQNVEKVSSQYITSKVEAPLQVEQMTFGIMKGSGNINELELEEGNTRDIDRKVLEDIKRQNPNLHFTTTEPSYTRTETIILNTTDLSEEEAKALMEKLQNDPSFMAQKSSEELSRMGIKVIQDLEDTKTASQDNVEVTRTRYSINPTTISTKQTVCNVEPKETDTQKDHVTEIQVVTPRTEKYSNERADITKDKISSRQRAPAAVKKFEEPILSYELDIDLLNDFMSNERYHSAKQQADVRKRTSQSSEPKKRHSDFDLPRNTTIKFRTATYESPKGTIVTSTDLENRRLSQLDQMQLRASSDQPVSSEKPIISAKPSNIPVKTLDKKPLGGFVSSKIPVFATQKSLSQENLSDKNFSLPRSPPPTLSNSSGNITITSIKTSSRSPSGGRL
ncbi:unnamed protein product [Euphydryas editha]|uniref:PDZ domain-containing protein n=1 Tax=Euphydryas editha TaxID=104508 RepID=A0AAU9UM69_EUPED|nr:unnamed protein product [Euphydryas editha]